MTVADAPFDNKERPFRQRLSLTKMLEIGVLIVVIGVAVTTYLVIASALAGGQLLSPALFAFLLVANLIPAVALLVLLGRRIARWRVAKSSTGGSKLHSRLVATFSLLASIPIVLTVIAASVMFQSGVQLWGSERARSAFESTILLAQEGQKVVAERWRDQALTMVGDIEREYGTVPSDSDEFNTFFLQQTYARSFYQSVLFQIPDGRTIDPLYAYEQPNEQEFLQRASGEILNFVDQNNEPFVNFNQDLVWVIAPVDRSRNLFLYVATPINADFLTAQTTSAREVVRDYRMLQGRSRSLQLTLALLLYGVALLIIALVIYIAMLVADRLVRPVDQLVDASQRVSEGDLTARVPTFDDPDELGRLGSAFNAMTDQLQQQTNALVSANSQIESRRALIEAVVEGVTAGVISTAGDRTIRLINSSALAMLKAGEGQALDRPLIEIAPELDHLLDSDSREAVVQLTAGGDARTLAVKIAADGDGRILTFDDITQQLLDQRRAAWSDVARRIAHEIKNPLTPIQLAAERLQRRYGKQIANDDGTFTRLTETIVRQVGDLRRMVDEFSSFARMPKPVFREESVIDLARQSLFLHEVAHPAIRFSIDHGNVSPSLVCDRRQIGQALTNIIKNAVEAVEAKGFDDGEREISMVLREVGDEQLIIEITDNGVGLPVERDRIIEPYMTTRARGTGLGLAIVKKIVDEHFGTINFADRPGGGTRVTLCFDAHLLANMVGAGEDEGGAGEARPAMLTRNSNG